MATVMLCASCGSQDTPKRVTRGSFLIEVFLWLCLLVPGIVYSLWRLTSKRSVCRACGQENLIPLTSPMAQSILQRTGQGPVAK